MIKKVLNRHRFVFLVLTIIIFFIAIAIMAHLKNISSPKKESPVPTKIPDYYGRSTLGNCTADDDCLVSGCNGEICQSKNEESLSSICVVPDKPLPKQLGYQCRCLVKKCQWVK